MRGYAVCRNNCIATHIAGSYFGPLYVWLFRRYTIGSSAHVDFQNEKNDIHKSIHFTVTFAAPEHTSCRMRYSYGPLQICVVHIIWAGGSHKFVRRQTNLRLLSEKRRPNMTASPDRTLATSDSVSGIRPYPSSFGRNVLRAYE